MFKRFTGGNRRFVRLLGFFVLLSLLRIGFTAMLKCRQKDNNDYPYEYNKNTSTITPLTRVPENKVANSQPEHFSSAEEQIIHLIRELSGEQKFKLIAQISSILSKTSSNFPSLNEPGLQVNKINGIFHITLDANEIHLTEISKILQKIELLYFPGSIASLELMNLPVEQSDALIIGRIFRKQSNISKLSLVNCTLNENVEKENFYKSFSFLFLEHLKIKECSGIEEILTNIQKSITNLTFNCNEVSFDFLNLTQLFEEMQDLESLTLEYNEIKKEGFDIFFQFISHLPKLIKLSLIDENVIEMSIAFLNANEFNAPLESLTLSNDPENVYTKDISPLGKLKSLKHLRLPFDIFLNHKLDTFISYLTKQTNLETFSIVERKLKSPLKIKSPPSRCDVLLDLSDIKYKFTGKLTTNQIQRITNLSVDNDCNYNTMSAIKKSGYLPKLRQLTWNHEQINLLPSVLTKCRSIDTLVIESKAFNQKNCDKLSADKIFLKNLQILRVHFTNQSTSEYELATDFIIFHYWIKSLQIYSSQFDFIEQLSDKIREKKIIFPNLEHFKVSQLKGESIFAFYNCLKSMPNIKEVWVFYSSYCEEIIHPEFVHWIHQFSENKIFFHKEKKVYWERERPFTPIILTPLPIEKLFLAPIEINCSCAGLMSLLFPNVPLLKTLHLLKLNSYNMKIVVDSLKWFPNLRHLRIIDCLVDELLIEGLINELKDLKWFSLLEVRSMPKQSHLYEPLSRMKLAFLIKIDLEWNPKDENNNSKVKRKIKN